MEMNRPMKQEDVDISLDSQLYTMPPLPPYPESFKSDGTIFGDWSFENSTSTDTFYPSMEFRHTTIDSSENGHDETHSTSPVPLYDQPNVELSSFLRLDTAPPSSPMFLSVPWKAPRSHIPRPPNAFMLYRSDFLKRGIIPSHVERRQQNLSRIAGQCWNLLPQEEKAQWQTRAAQVLLEHQKLNPDYKFTPAPRGSRRPKGKGRSDNDEVVDGEERIRQIRETYTPNTGPTAKPARRRRLRIQNRSRDLEAGPARKSPLTEAYPSLLPPSIPPSPSPSISSPEINYQRETPLPAFFPHHAIPRITPPRRPSTSLGFTTSTTFRETASPSPQAGHFLARPSSAASETGLTSYMKELDITPMVPTFGKISPPASPVSLPPQDLFLPQSPELQDELVFPTLNPSYPSVSSTETLSDVSSTASDSFLASFYSNDGFAFDLPIVPAEQEFAALDGSYILDAYDPSSFHDAWNLDTSLTTNHMRSYTL